LVWRSIENWKRVLPVDVVMPVAAVDDLAELTTNCLMYGQLGYCWPGWHGSRSQGVGQPQILSGGFPGYPDLPPWEAYKLGDQSKGGGLDNLIFHPGRLQQQQGPAGGSMRLLASRASPGYACNIGQFLGSSQTFRVYARH
jgi:hypothetical protein